MLALTGPDGWPFAVRLAVRAERASGVIRLDGEPLGVPWQPGLACITAHAHPPNFRWQRNFQVRGDLVEDERGWALVPHKVVGGLEIPKGRLATVRENAAKARRYRRTAKRRMAART